jgi:DNA-binding CsgD family transcriptional regulator
MLTDEAAYETIHALWDDLTHFDAAHADDALDYLLEKLCAQVGGKNAYWIGAIRLSDSRPDDPVQGWRPGMVRHLHLTPVIETRVREMSNEIHVGRIDASVAANVRSAGRFRAVLIRDLVPPEWFSSPYYKINYEAVGVYDTIFVTFPVNPDAECYYGFHLGEPNARFTPQQRDLLAYALRGIRWFHRQLMLSYGLLIADSPLTPAERRVLERLLEGRAEKDISRLLGQSQHTTHEYVKSLYRKFGVNNRAALMALWLGTSG